MNFSRLKRQHLQKRSRKPSAYEESRYQAILEKRREDFEAWILGKTEEREIIWQSTTICAQTISHRHTRTHHTHNNAQHPLSNPDHDGQHLLPAAGSRDADRNGHGYGVELLILLAGSHPQPCARLLCQLGILRAQEEGKSLRFMSRQREELVTA